MTPREDAHTARETCMSVARHSSFVTVSLVAIAATSIAACSGGGSTTPAPTPRPTAGACTAGQSTARRTFTVDGRSYVMAGMSKSGAGKWVPGQMWVQFSSPSYRTETAGALQSVHAVADGQTDRAGFQTFDLPAGQDVDLAVAAMQGKPGVRRAGKLALRYPQVAPNDPSF